ncbi:hypothetical protein KsCSTR_29920 [Candidatus Kuenenia stuttgartiensis]|uniref:Uncharacterized protein n=1 Tax=Kuenenia stuttgartiensis TaxID=174633 RepID=Q1Q5L1_KUEST|nr:hypothetical protein KsCSTR_29920 [Candidatus Kuenenia stuttgartiensis]CAJ75306.1 unknown protein [Candidatus Kuenenia stuttgartiensis]
MFYDNISFLFIHTIQQLFFHSWSTPLDNKHLMELMYFFKLWRLAYLSRFYKQPKSFVIAKTRRKTCLFRM